MNKKFLSAILFGALMVSSTGTFVSCKDYDDDINDLQEQINKKASLDELTSKVSALESQLGEAKASLIAAEATAKAAKEAADKAAADAAASKTEAAQAAAEAAAAKAATAQAAAEAKKAAIDAAEAKMKELKKAIDADIKLSTDAIKDLLKDAEKLAADVEAIVGKKLFSLVFQPQFYYHGIEAMEAKGFTYVALTTEKVDANGDYKDDAPVAGASQTTVPDLVADYHINPSKAEVPSDVEAYSFLAFDKTYTRAASTVITPKVKKAVAKDGMLTVTAAITDGIIKQLATDGNGEVTVLALQVNNNDTIVTSDYAAVKASNYKELEIAAVDELHPIATDDQHLFTTAAEAIAHPAHAKIVWNSEGVDIATLINTHYTDLAGAHAKFGETAADGTVEKYGFKYSYELVGYLKGNNKTSESAHAALNGSVIRPQITSGGEQQAWGAQQNIATVNREPLVRITLTDETSGKIAAVGYLKFEIVAEAPENTVLLDKTFSFADGYTISCDGKDVPLALTWHQIEEQILAQLANLGISKDDFHKNFTLDATDTDATQFDGTKTDSKTVTTKTGVVAQTTWDAADEMTEVLTWTIKNNEAYQAFKAGEKKLSATVRYITKVAKANGTHDFVYITLTWTPATLNITPNGTIADAAKINKYWYEKNGAVAGEGYSDIHANVQQVISDNAADCTFDSEILNTFTGNKITVTSDATYPNFADGKLTKTVVFANPQDHLAKDGTVYVAYGATGTKYAISVSTDGKTLNATSGTVTNAVVKLSGTVMEYQANDFAKDLLNKEDHNLLGDGQTFTAKLQVNAANCDWVAYNLTNNVFYAKYLRPVSVKPADVDELVDATNGASIAALNLNLIDWRDKYFDKVADTTGDDGTKYNFYGFYGVTSIKADIANATCDLNNGSLDTQKLSSVTEKVKLYFGADKSATNEFTTAKVGDNGKFYYYNNGTTLGKFTIRVPMTVTYKWGTIHTSVDLNINKTIQN